MLYAIVAHDDNLGIGVSGHLPWHLSEDLQHFRNVTSKAVVIMGMATWNSLPEAFRPLPNRFNIVVSRFAKPGSGDGAYFCNTIHDAIRIAKIEADHRGTDAFVIGGSQIYEQSMDLIDGLYVTLVHGSFLVDRYFCEYRGKFANSEVLAKGTSAAGLDYTMMKYLR